MFIQTETTPNPATLKFLPGRAVMSQGTAHFESQEDAKRSPLATRLFAVDGVEGVFLGADFVSVSKDTETRWEVIKPMILSAIMDHYLSGDEMAVIGDDGAETGEAESEIVAQIRELLETRVRPAVAQDGGDIVFRGFEDGVVYLHMRGACSGCPSSTMTLKNGIENMLRYYVPEVQAVQSV